jgi:hypothetical protein
MAMPISSADPLLFQAAAARDDQTRDCERSDRRIFDPDGFLAEALNS